MGDIKTEAADVFREKEAPGSAIDHEPVKSDIRALFALIDIVVSAASGNLLRYRTKALMDADTGQPDGVLAYVFENNGDPADPLNGFYQWDDSGNAWDVADWYLTGIIEPAAAIAAENVSDASIAILDAATAARILTLMGTPGFDTAFPNAYAAALPRGVTSGTVGGTAVTGATVGEYPLTLTGGDISGAQLTLVVTSATVATIRVDNPGLGSGTTPPTITVPPGATLPGGTTLTAVVGFRTPAEEAYFVLSTDKLSLQAYKRTLASGTPVIIADLAIPTKAYIDALAARDIDYESDYSQLPLLGQVGTDGNYVTFDNGLRVYSLGYETDWTGVVSIDCGSDGAMLTVYYDTATMAAQASVDAITTRLDRALTARGNSKSGYMRPHANRRWRRAIRARSRGDALKIVHLMFGDSWSHGSYYWSHWLRQLIASYVAPGGAVMGPVGDGGLGWVGFGNPGVTLPNGNVRLKGTGIPGVGVTFSGTGWASHYDASSNSPDICDSYSAIALDLITVVCDDATLPALNGVNLHYKTGQGGTVEYRWGGSGGWTTLALNGSGIAALAGFPTGGGAFTFEIRVASGTCTLYGINGTSAASGYVAHKLAATGRRMSEFATRSANAEWRTGIGSLVAGANMVLVTIGTPINDRGGGQLPAAYATSCRTIIDAVRVVYPNAEIVLFVPPELGINVTPVMADYVAGIEPLLDEYDGLSIFNMQTVVPAASTYLEADARYGPASDYPFFVADKVHPSFPFGERGLEDGWTRHLLDT